MNCDAARRVLKMQLASVAQSLPARALASHTSTGMHGHTKAQI